LSDIDRRRRQFVREHHPDLGGDPETFIAGMRAFEAEQAPWTSAATVVVIKREKWLARLVSAAGRRRHRGRKSPRVR
jgi:hypothetical protein